MFLIPKTKSYIFTYLKLGPDKSVSKNCDTCMLFGANDNTQKSRDSFRHKKFSINKFKVFFLIYRGYCVSRSPINNVPPVTTRTCFNDGTIN